ncbi:serine protease [Mycobacterium sp. ITM-2016-00317]|uniref:trypsin-like serine peptidase n=1 Tax=Mycobacterium sp. ITM-2016-00317 TaxID=2099694 RepID=UPI000D462E95|nr:serine protease [Mycobacterium sp. ITM-2016-00317]WNG89676.1 serine protease [Mycobacterium sp. ITM-2016-00317]
MFEHAHADVTFREEPATGRIGGVGGLRRACPLLAAALLGACAGTEPAPSPPPAGGLPSATPVAPDPRVGAVFAGAADRHVCTGSVLDSAAGDLILTAAHCLPDGVAAVFVPEFGAGRTPRDGWRIDAVFLDPRWVDGSEPAADYAIARVSRADGKRLPPPVGGGLELGAAPESGQEVTVIGYPAGVGGGPSVCRAPAGFARQGFPTLHCAGVVDGFSGAPWISGPTVTGLIGGLDGGGCAEEVSFSPPFDDGIAALMARAEAGGPGDEAPGAFDDGCA